MSVAAGAQLIGSNADEVAISASSSPEVSGDYTHQQFESKYGEFLSSSFDAVQYAQRIAGSGAQSSQAQEAGDGITQLMGTLASRADSLESLLKHTILRSHEELLQQVISVRAVDSSLGLIEDQVREIKAYMHGLRTKVRVPYEQALMYTRQAANLQAATACVRGTSKFIQLVRRLRAQIPDAALDGGGRADFALAALTLLDIEKLVGGSALGGVRLVDQALADVVAVRRALTTAEAERLVGGGMQRAHQSDIGAGLQILFNLGTLPGVVAATVRRHTVEWAGHVAGRLDPKAVHAQVREHNAQATAGDGSDMTGVTAVLWARLEALVDDLASRGMELRALERVLARKRDVLPRFDVSVGALDSSAAAGVSFLDVAVARLGDRPLAFWWGTAVAALAAEIDAACAESSVVRQTLTNGYARLVTLFVPKLESILAPCLGGVVSVGSGEPADAGLALAVRSACVSPQMPHVLYGDPGPAVLWGRLLARFEAEYVKRAAARIEDAVGRCFPPPPPPGLVDAQEAWTNQKPRGGAADASAAGPPPVDLMSGAPPSRKLVAGIVRSITTELEMAKSDTRLGAAVAHAAAAAVASFVAASAAKLAAIVAANPGPLRLVESPLLAKYCVGLINAAESLRSGLAALCESEYGGSDSLAVAAATTRLRQLQSDNSRHRRSQSSISLPSSPRPGSVAGFAADSSSPASSLAAIVREALNACEQDLLALISRQTDLLLDAADTVITESIINGGNAADSSGDQTEPPFESSMQWLQTQVLEPLETDYCRRPVSAMVDRYLCLYTRVVCLTFPLNEAAKLRLTAEVTQFEFACSQLITASASKGGSIAPPKLADVGRSYRALRLVRPLLFTDIAELLTAIQNIASVVQSWSDLPLFDLVDHILCRVATELVGDSDDHKPTLPYVLLGWSKRQWIEELIANDHADVKRSSTLTTSIRQALTQSVDQLLATASSTGVTQLLQAVKNALSSSK
ncbi:Conserved oligomeric Golgi complex subunit [Coemansia sp. S142-1]|nr:Conserved oligomeric Golgi complex subunit [Coemansia sp. S142-1]